MSKFDALLKCFFCLSSALLLGLGRNIIREQDLSGPRSSIDFDVCSPLGIVSEASLR